MISAIKKRRSIREYLNQNISEEKIKEIIMAAMFAPSANGLYPWDLVVVRNSETKDLLAKATPFSTHGKDADAIIAVIGHEKESPDWVEDCSIVAEHLWLEAAEQGVGACWIQIRGNETAEEGVKKALNVPKDHRVLCLMSLGMPVKELPEHSEEEFDKSKVKQEKYK